MSELPEKKIGFRLESGLKRQKNCNKLVFNNSLRKKEDCKNKLKLKKQSFNLQFESKNNSNKFKRNYKNNAKIF